MVQPFGWPTPTSRPGSAGTTRRGPPHSCGPRSCEEGGGWSAAEVVGSEALADEPALCVSLPGSGHQPELARHLRPGDEIRLVVAVRVSHVQHPVVLTGSPGAQPVRD